jgi:4-amino-4-deoxy-L-arabinose transferase-like glycosyltransferase
MKYKWVLIAVIIGLVLRLLTLNNAISFDEYVQVKAVLEANPAGLDKLTEMNPLTTWTRLMFTHIFGVSVWVLRSVSLLFAVLTGIVLYLLGKELYDRKTALWAVALLSLSALHMLVSTSISFDGTFLTFYTLLTMYCYVKYSKTLDRNWLIYCGLAFGLCVLTKYTGVLVFFAVMLYSLVLNKSFTKTCYECFFIGICGLLVYSVFPLVAFVLSDPSYFWISLQHGQNYFGGRMISLPLLLIQYALALIWIGPLLFFGYLLSFRKFKQSDWLLHFLVFVVFAFYTFVVQDPFRPVERYFTVFLPVLCLLTGKYFANLKLDRKQFAIMVSGFGLLLFFWYLVASLPMAVLAFYPKTAFISAVLHFKWSFLMPFTGDQGPIGLYVSFLVIALAFIFSLVCFICVLLGKRNSAVILLSVGLSFSVFFMVEMALHPMSPDISAVTKETAAYVSNLTSPYFVFRDYAIRYYLDKGTTQFDFDSNVTYVRSKLQKHGTLIVVDFPALDKEGALWKNFTLCKQLTNVSSRGLVMGYVFAC